MYYCYHLQYPGKEFSRNMAIIDIDNWCRQIVNTIVDVNTLLLAYTKYSLPILHKILGYTIGIDKFVNDHCTPQYFCLVPGGKYWHIQFCRCQ